RRIITVSSIRNRVGRGKNFREDHWWGMAAFLKQLESSGVPGFRSTRRGAVAIGWAINAVLFVSLSACSGGGVGGGAPSTTEESVASATATPTPTATALSTPAPTPTAAPVNPTQKPAPPANT